MTNFDKSKIPISKINLSIGIPQYRFQITLELIIFIDVLILIDNHIFEILSSYLLLIYSEHNLISFIKLFFIFLFL
jgi:hypothetical protein